MIAHIYFIATMYFYLISTLKAQITMHGSPHQFLNLLGNLIVKFVKKNQQTDQYPLQSDL